MNDSSSPQVPQDSPLSTPQPGSAFERWRRNAMLVTGLGMSDSERLENKQISQIEACEKKKEYLMNYSPVIVFMLKHLNLSGCNVPPSNVLCAPCDRIQAGGFTPDPGAVVLCAGQFFSEQHLESTITHELIHMYDHCRFKVDWSNLRHHACSEHEDTREQPERRLSVHTRAPPRLRVVFEAASGGSPCTSFPDVLKALLIISCWRVFFSLQACVRRRAVESVKANPACPNEAAAERAVNEVWESCFNDTRPFDEIY
ncbi:hypothetical protein NLJ89_g526 [Agrocybe chaxingu]|uniref:Mitochondrial inner membrane protease ATP23 n=1 Tax=Agrocybe chaxingu TaxID=84603 RepID=A0A9W8TGE4_9AGAR|nr:hypothetical protein NLJ89_g526 [Agrocybe chaxingu]